ncbi:MAG: hypothetical protein ERJ69_03025 [Aphanocapsa feldmannii 288cV]|nr:MAG: hypothetical protein ERJ69_03025 [Aphanocapsa feldmannii 288cV]
MIPAACMVMNRLIPLLPMAGVVVVPLLVPLLMVRVGIGYGLGAALVVVVLWFAVMVRHARMPGHG